MYKRAYALGAQQALIKLGFAEDHPYATGALLGPLSGLTAPEGHGWDVAGKGLLGGVIGAGSGAGLGALAAVLSRGRLPMGSAITIGRNLGAAAGTTVGAGKGLRDAYDSPMAKLRKLVNMG